MAHRFNPQHQMAQCDEGRVGDDDRPDLTEDQRAHARRVVAGGSIDAADAAQLMMMLGIYPGQESRGFVTPPNTPHLNCS